MIAEQSGHTHGTCSQMDSAEHEEQARGHRSFRQIWKERDNAEPELLERILATDNLARAYKRVKANGGAPGVDGMDVMEARSWLNGNYKELVVRIKRGKYTPKPVRRVEIPKPDGGVRKLGIPTVVDRVIQQAMAQQLMPIYEPLFAEGSYGYRPKRSAQDAILRVKEYAEQGYTYVVVLDLSKYFDTLDHNLLLNILRRNVKDERVIQLIKRFLKSGVMEGDTLVATNEGSPQGGNLSPLLANVYLNEFDQEFASRGVPEVRYADDIVLLAKSRRAAERLLKSSVDYLEGKLKLTVNRTKSRVVSICSKDFKYLGFTLGKDKDGFHVRVHEKSWKKFKSNLRNFSSRKHAQSILKAYVEITRYARGWLNYFGIAQMKSRLEAINSWLYHRIRMCIWKQWKRVRTRLRKLRGLKVSENLARAAAFSRRGYWFVSNTRAVKTALTKKRLVAWGFFDLSSYYQSLH